MLVTFLAVAAIATGITLLAVIMWRRNPSEAAAALLMFGLLGMSTGLFGSLIAQNIDGKNLTVEALETRYDITIEKANWRETPTQWRIDNNWRTCYIADLDAAKDELELLCSAETTEYAHP